ncbi:hypothetical protein ES703_123273 [subsurface metagenome]|jgi:hypothetical protein
MDLLTNIYLLFIISIQLEFRRRTSIAEIEFPEYVTFTRKKDYIGVKV